MNEREEKNKRCTSEDKYRLDNQEEIIEPSPFDLYINLNPY